MPRRLIGWASRRIGNRGVVLFTFGLMWTIYGVGIFIDDEARTIGLPEDWFWWWLRGLWWCVPGIMAMTCAIVKKGTEDATAWGALMLPVFIRWGSIVVAWIMDLTNSGKWQHYPRPWAGFVIFLAFIIVIDRDAVGLDRPPPPEQARKRRKS